METTDCINTMTGVNVKLTDDISIGTGCGLVLIAGPCVAESKELCLQVAAGALQCCQDLGIKYIFKASFDKANRTSGTSFRGRGIDEGLEILATVKEEFDIPVITDVHEPWQCEQCKEVVDLLPLERILLETDAPYMAPDPFRGKRNDSAKLSLVAEKIAEIKGIPVEKVYEQTKENACSFFAD